MSVYAELMRSRSLARERWSLSLQAIEAGVAALDAAIIIGVSVLAAAAFHLWAYGAPSDPELYIGLGTVVAALFVPRKWYQGHYSPVELLDFRRQVRRLVLDWLVTFIVLGGIAFALKAGADFSRGATLSFAALGPMALILHRALSYSILKDAHTRGSLRGKKVALLQIGEGHKPNDARIGSLLDYGFEIVTTLTLPSDNFDNEEKWREFLSTLNRETYGSDIEEILIDVDWEQARTLAAALEKLRLIPLPIHVIPDIKTANVLTKPTRRFGSTVTIELQRAPLTCTERVIKRSIDTVISATGLILLLPLLCVIAVAIKLDSNGPVLFRQSRRGFNGRPFTILKFRTMTVMEDGDFVMQACQADPRVTRVGMVLRQLSFDELPQLINVLRGEMSIVGPRPHAISHDNYYDKLIANYALRHHVKPGLTGWAQVNGFRGETPTVDLMATRVELDLRYIDSWSLWLDLQIVFRTCIEVFRSPNAY
jgi:putative colanic acid biosysnthesis UDP-glucose lipid carrier transferase